MKIAVIGSGIAGLTSAYLLRNHSCELFEAKPFVALAGHALKLDNGEIIDIPLRVIHREYYPYLFSLCHELFIPLRKLEHSGSFSLSHVSTGFEYSSLKLLEKRYNFIKPKWSHLETGVFFMHFYYLCHKYKDDTSYELISFGEFLKKHKISRKLSRVILFPLLSSICTCTYNDLELFPSRVLLEMMSMIAGPIPMERFYTGTHDIENALRKNIDKVHLSSKVDKVIIHEDGAEVVINEEVRKFDHIVIATEAHIIKNFLLENEYTKSVLSCLNSIPYKNTDTVIHTVDESNEQIKSKKSLHYQEHPNEGEAQASMWLNKVEPHLNLQGPTLQTWNPVEERINTELKRSTLSRALMTVESYQAVKKLQELKHPCFSLAGSYLSKGVPLLEGGVESAYHLSQQISS